MEGIRACLPRSPLVADVDVPDELVQEAVLGTLCAGLRVVGLLLTLGRVANPRHGFLKHLPGPLGPAAGSLLDGVLSSVLPARGRAFVCPPICLARDESRRADRIGPPWV